MKARRAVARAARHFRGGCRPLSTARLRSCVRWGALYEAGLGSADGRVRQRAASGVFLSVRSQASSHAGIASVPAKRRIAAREPTGPDWRDQAKRSSQSRRVLPWVSRDASAMRRRALPADDGRSPSSSTHHASRRSRTLNDRIAEPFCKQSAQVRRSLAHRSAAREKNERAPHRRRKEPSSSPAANYNRSHKQDAQVRVTQEEDGRQEIEAPAPRRADAGHRLVERRRRRARAPV